MDSKSMTKATVIALETLRLRVPSNVKPNVQALVKLSLALEAHTAALTAVAEAFADAIVHGADAAEHTMDAVNKSHDTRAALDDARQSFLRDTVQP